MSTWIKHARAILKTAPCCFIMRLVGDVWGSDDFVFVCIGCALPDGEFMMLSFSLDRSSGLAMRYDAMRFSVAEMREGGSA
jgi:hypothetical protein